MYPDLERPLCEDEEVEVDMREGRPKIGLGGVMTGLLERLRVAKRSDSRGLENEPVVGVLREEREEAGVDARERVVWRWAWVSMSRIGGGCCMRMQRGYARRELNSDARARER